MGNTTEATDSKRQKPNLKIDSNSFITNYVWNNGLKSKEMFKIHGNQQKSKDFEIVTL